MTVARDQQAGAITREANYSTFDVREDASSDVIQRTEDGFSRDGTHTLPNGETHTQNVDVSCEKDVGKCVRQVEVDEQPYIEQQQGLAKGPWRKPPRTQGAV